MADDTIRLQDSSNKLLAVPEDVGFSLEQYRHVNRIRLCISAKGKQPYEFFSAFNTGVTELNYNISSSSFSEVMTKLNDMGPYWRSMMSSVTSSLGTEVSGVFDMPVKPYLKGTEPIVMELKCILPLITDYQFDIQNPIANLLKVYLPTRQFETKTNDITNSVKEWFDDVFEGEENSFWLAIKNSIKGFLTDFVEDIYILNNPIQYNSENTITLKIGSITIPSVYITSVKISYGKFIYVDGNNAYPSHADISIGITTRHRATTNISDITGYNAKLDDFVK